MHPTAHIYPYDVHASIDVRDTAFGHQAAHGLKNAHQCHTLQLYPHTRLNLYRALLL